MSRNKDTAISGGDDDLKEPLCRIVCAAIRHPGTIRGQRVIIAGARHYDEIMRANILALFHHVMDRETAIKLARHDGWYACEQGFIDQKGEFLTREEAWPIAEAAGQIRNKVGPDGILYSENLY
jgi:hypothetical protein